MKTGLKYTLRKKNLYMYIYVTVKYNMRLTKMNFSLVMKTKPGLKQKNLELNCNTPSIYHI